MPEVLPLRPDDPRRVGRYRLSGRVRGMTEPADPPDVFLARRVDGDTALVTFLGRDRASDPAARDRFSAEARTARRVAPFCAARILDAGFEGAEPYLVTEFVPGPTLLEMVQQQGPLPPEMVAGLAIGAATGLAAIHQAGLVHGRFGPRAVVLSPEGPRVVHVSITPPYGAATPAADLLEWAHTVLFAALGRPMAGPRDLASLPEDVRAPLAACLEPDPSGRPTARSLLTRLLSRHNITVGLLAEGARHAAAAAVAPPRARDQSHAPQRRGRSRMPRAAWWAAACGVCGVAAVAGVLSLAHPGRPAASARRSHSPRPRAVATIPPQFAGRWSGPVHQTNPVLTVGVRIVMTAGASQGSISYPALGCAGRLAVAASDGNRISVRQIITAGQRNCENGVITLVRGPSGQITFTFLRPGGASPTGVLARTSP